MASIISGKKEDEQKIEPNEIAKSGRNRSAQLIDVQGPDEEHQKKDEARGQTGE